MATAAKQVLISDISLFDKYCRVGLDAAQFQNKYNSVLLLLLVVVVVVLLLLLLLFMLLLLLLIPQTYL